MAAYLIVVATATTGAKAALLAGGLLAFTLAVAGTVIPSAVLAWILPDDEEAADAAE